MAQQRRGGFKRRKKVDYIAANKIEYVDYKDTEKRSSGPLFHELGNKKANKILTGLFFTSLEMRRRVQSGWTSFSDFYRILLERISC